VKKGDKIKAKEALGKIFTDSNGKTEMKFFLGKRIKKIKNAFFAQILCVFCTTTFMKSVISLQRELKASCA